MKDLLKLFKTIMDFKGLPSLVTKQSTIKKLRLLFLPWLLIHRVRKNKDEPVQDGLFDESKSGGEDGRVLTRSLVNGLLCGADGQHNATTPTGRIIC